MLDENYQKYFQYKSRRKNAENLLMVRVKTLAAKYLENWKVHEGHSEVYQGRQK